MSTLSGLLTKTTILTALFLCCGVANAKPVLGSACKASNGTMSTWTKCHAAGLPTLCCNRRAAVEVSEERQKISDTEIEAPKVESAAQPAPKKKP
jgi:hypothetical protein